MNLLRATTMLLYATMFWRIVKNHNQTVLRD